MATVEIINYKSLLDRLMLARPEPSHLLLGNGFNNSLGVKDKLPRNFQSYEILVQKLSNLGRVRRKEGVRH